MIFLRWERQRRTRIFSSTALTEAANMGESDDTRLFLLGRQLGGYVQAQRARAEAREHRMGTTEQPLSPEKWSIPSGVFVPAAPHWPLSWTHGGQGSGLSLPGVSQLPWASWVRPDLYT